ncbi:MULTISPECIES: four-carbon acid sugar kinase family protein [Pseudomonas]|uniref:Four-carbon acid sugar kinase family protein n=1 Tax=Pseudomonas quercus TaxID=2722792 RepID=A0ABX0YKC9_9PSED|nr:MULTISPECIES: four-carbon acid sugar kinase family protein [Pseudomonas]MBF7144825.1 four-carbon acid sugar kinase family protein [Pseudomonas sp. LY10J]NJP03362.1 four-carbon acid sugar kinase family protein [Pseudomonas quercus]
MTDSLLVIADDLSGAADCAVGFTGQCLARVVIGSAVGALQPGVTALDLDTRRLSPQQAADAQQAVLAQPLLAACPLYKKVDSTLRGNVVSEVIALLGRGMALVAPAFPALGRTTRSGVQWLGEAPVSDSDVWANEGLSGSADLLALFGAQGVRVAGLSRSALAQPDLPQVVRQHCTQGTQVLVCDALYEEDLALLATASAPLWAQVFWVGSAGLARHLALELSLPPVTGNHRQAGLTGPVLVEPNLAGPVLTVVGSMSAHSHGQAEYLAGHTAPFRLQLSPRLLVADEAQPQRDEWAAQLAHALANGQDALVTLIQVGRDPAQGPALSQALGALLKGPLAHAGCLIATGGETARAVLSHAGVDVLELHTELTPGVACATACHGGRRLIVITKAGGFGQPATLHNAWCQVRASEGAIAPATALLEKDTPHV